MTIHLSSGSLGSRVRPKHDDTLEDTVLMRAFEPEVADVTLRPSACSNRPRSPLLLTGRSTTSTPCTSTAATTTAGAGPARSVGPDDLGHPTTRHQGPRRPQTTDPARAAMDRHHDRLKHLIGDLMWPTPAGPYTPDRFSTVISEPGPPPTHRLGRRLRPDPQTRHRGPRLLPALPATRQDQTQSDPRPQTAHLRPHLDAPPTHKPIPALDIEAHPPAPPLAKPATTPTHHPRQQHD